MHRIMHMVLVSLLLVIPGCTAPATIEEVTIDESNEEDGMVVPERLNIIANTAGRDIDRGTSMDLLADANGESTLILWVSTGCSGCHDWTEMIANEMRSGNISNDTRIVTIHRYPSFESREEVIETYASNNSSTDSLWPVLVPDNRQPAIDVDRNQETDYDYTQAFESPSTPSFTILDGSGKTIWKNREYWSNHDVLEEALSYLN